MPVPKDATFRRTTSRARRFYVTSVAFPSVQVGAILDYQYSVRWDSIFFLEPWFFQDRVPVLHSEIAYEVPRHLRATLWQSDPLHAGIKSEAANSVLGTRVRAWADHLPAVPEEVHSLPFADMAAQLMVLPTAYVTRNLAEHLFESWPATCKLFEDEYDQARRKDGDAARRAREIAARAAASPAAAASTGPSLQRRQAAAIYDFVRDEVATEDANRVWLPQYSSAGAVLDRRRGEPAEKAVLLQAMLAAVRIDSRLVWAADRENGAIDMQIANPAWFDRVLVAAQIDGQRVFLDAADRSLGFGRLEPGYEGTRALVFDGRKPESIVLPEAPFGENLRRARVELTLDSGGRATGVGTLTLLGQAAWRRDRWTGDAWQRWLREQFQGFEVGDVIVAEKVDEARVDVAWTLSQHPEEALGDQATFVASRPLGPLHQLFPPGAKRFSAVVFEFAERSEGELIVHWAAGWQPEVLPRAWKHSTASTAAGAVETSVDVDGAGRTLVYRRRFDNAHRQAATAEQFHLVQALFEEAQKSDAQPLVLSRR